MSVGCTRSHPHEDMDEFCELHTAIARQGNQIARLTALIEEHNYSCEDKCGVGFAGRLCRDYTSRGRRCPDCPKDYMISMEGE